MRLISLAAVVATCLVMVSCSSTKSNFMNVPGYIQTHKIQTDLYQISYTGTAGMSLDQAKSIAGQRASALCIAEGFRYFVVLQKSVGFATQAAQPGAAPDSLAAIPHQVPVIKGQVRFFKKEPKVETQAVYDAEQTQDSFRAFN